MATGSMRSVLEATGVEFGATPAGRAWCIKALNPAEVGLETSGAPDKSSARTLVLQYEMETRIAFPSAAGSPNSWGLDAQFIPHPVNFMFGRFKDDTGGYVAQPLGVFECLNDKMPGDGHAEKFRAFMQEVTVYRLAYAGLTLRLDAPSTDCQGTLLACQRVINNYEYGISGSVITIQAPQKAAASAPSVGASVYSAICPLPKLCVWPGENGIPGPSQPVYTRCAIPNHYSGDAKEGVYVPLHLTENALRWRGYSDSVVWTPRGATDAQFAPLIVSTHEELGVEGPHPTLTGAYFDAEHGVGCYDALTAPFLSDVACDICLTNLSPKASLNLTFRIGIEVQVQPQSALQGQVRIAPPHDPLALTSYFAVTRQLKDAYPASYNDWGKIWGVIKRAASTVLPLAAPLLGSNPIGAAVMSLAPMAIRGVDKLAERSKQKKLTKAEARGSVVSQAEIEKLRASQAALKR